MDHITFKTIRLSCTESRELVAWQHYMFRIT